MVSGLVSWEFVGRIGGCQGPLSPYQPMFVSGSSPVKDLEAVLVPEATVSPLNLGVEFLNSQHTAIRDLRWNLGFPQAMTTPELSPHPLRRQQKDRRQPFATKIGHPQPLTILTLKFPKL